MILVHLVSHLKMRSLLFPFSALQAINKELLYESRYEGTLSEPLLEYNQFYPSFLNKKKDM